MSKQLKETLGWGIALWLIGYLLGIALFAFVPSSIIGWIIMPVGVLITSWVVWKKIQNKTMQQYLLIALSWTAIAIVFDYVFLVLIFKPADGYYKLDVYLYYILTFILPLGIGWYKNLPQKRRV